MKFLSNFRPLFFSSLFVTYLTFLCACSNDILSTEPYHDTGSINVTIKVSYLTEDQTNDRILMAADEECGYAGVESVKAEIYDNMDNLIAEGGPWPCSFENGIIENVPAGSDFTIAILVLDTNGNVKYRGEQTNITVFPNETTTLDSIHAYLFYPILFCPMNNVVISDNSIYLEWEYVLKAKKYNIIVSKNEDLSEPIVKTITEDDTLFFNISNLESHVTYYWQVSALDLNNNQSIGSETWHFMIDPEGDSYNDECDYD